MLATFCDIINQMNRTLIPLIRIIISCTFFIYSASFAEDDRDLFIQWLNNVDKTTAQSLIFNTSSKFRYKYGPFTSRYADSAKTNWKTAFLDIANEEFSSLYGKTISDFCDLTNRQIKEGISPDQSRYSDLSRRDFSVLYRNYLSVNFELIKQGLEPTTFNVNKTAWKQSSKVLPLESMGGNAGPGAIAVNFLTDLNGRIVFVGNFQDSPPEIIKTYHRGLLKDGTVIYSVDPSIWQLKLDSRLDSDAVRRLTESLTAYNGAAPIPENEIFRVACRAALKKLINSHR